MERKQPVVDIGKIDDPAELLTHLRSDRNPVRRMKIVARLGKRKDVSPEIVTELGEFAFGESSTQVQNELVRTIDTIGGPTAIDALRIISFCSRSPEVRQDADHKILVLKTSTARTPSPESTTQRLLGMLRIGGVWQDRLEALYLLKACGVSQKTAREIARNASQETAKPVQQPMLAVLVEHLGTAALPTLQQLAKSPNWAGVREEVKSEIAALRFQVRIAAFRSHVREQQKALRKQLPQPPKVKRAKPLTLAGA